MNKNNIIYRTYTVHIKNNNQFYKNLIDISKINKVIFNSIIFFFKQNYFYYQNLINNNQITLTFLKTKINKAEYNFLKNNYSHMINIPHKLLYCLK